MGTRTFAILCIALMGCASDSPGASDPTPDVIDAVVVDVPRAACDEAIGGHVELTTETAFEAFPGYDEELAALDFDTLPETLNLGSLFIHERSFTAYMLHIPLAELPDEITRAEVAAIEPMGKAVLGAFAAAAAVGDEGIDLPFLRRGLHRFYQCDRQFPLHLDGFRAAIFEYEDEPSYEVMSVPKNDIRRIRENAEAGVYVAETWIEGTLRETEILLTHSRSDGALDFLVYDHEGNLMDRSEFVTASGATVGGASPYGCIACHFEGGSFEITVLFPEMDPVVPPQENP